MSRKSKAQKELELRIGYSFGNPALLDRALTHISALAGAKNRAGSYQRLEFLGDHVLGLVISDMLFRAFPDAEEGELSRRLADLVRRTVILADICEALIGAVFIDGGYASSAGLVERFWQERMLKPTQPLRDAKTMLQEWAQARGMPAPLYRELERSGPDHDPEFRVAVEIADCRPAEGVGRSKRAAEQAAAAAMLMREGVEAERAEG